ncbi:MAG: hypothetical protein QOF25_256 [Mycobacterium sp.]|nr:hypothetical protein [Mycobacterium sp.]
MNDDTDGPPAPIPLALLADLQAGLLDDDTAATIRRRVRDDPEQARRMDGLDRVRRDLADLGTDPTSAPDAPAEVTARVAAALRAEPPPMHRIVGSTTMTAAHAARGSGPRFRVAAAAIGAGAALIAAGVGTVILLHTPDRTPTTDPTAERITVSNPVGGLPMTDPEILELLRQPPDLGPLADPQRRASCLSGLGYPTSAAVLGARPLAVGGRSGVLVLLPGDTSRAVNAVVVALNCSSVDTGLLAERVVTRP